MTIGIVGLGLIGASFARSLKARTDYKVYGTDMSDEVLTKASLIGAIDDVLTPSNASDVDILVISVYPRSVKDTLAEYVPHLKKGAIVIDFCGIKRGVCHEMKAMSEKYKGILFFGGHPMAGREFSTIDHSMPSLFDKASMIIVPISSDIFKEEELKNLFLTLGFGSVVFTTAEEHDRIIAFTSELCHIVSNAYIKSPTAIEHHGFSAGSYRDLTRVARNNSTLWSELMIDNRDDLLFELNTLIENLTEYKIALEESDEESLRTLLEEGNRIKLTIDKRGKK